MKVFRNKYGFYELTEKPAPEDLRHYYADKYYQQSLSSYSKEYSAEELKYIRNKIEQKYALIAGQFEGRLPLKLLDVGCGEGYTLSFFKNMGWQVKGLDVSEAGIKQHNP
jgi:2-polyprenyl-3-methyl-5-hydroxy-6-metoxy-1,4-benzoquinol methylase